MSLRAYCTGGGNTASTATITVTLPGSALVGDSLFVGTTANLNAGTLTSTGTMAVLSGPDANTTAQTSYLLGRTLDATDISTGSVTLVWSLASKGTAAGVVLTPSGTPTFAFVGANANTVAVPVLTGTQDVLEIGLVRVLSGTHATITLPIATGVTTFNETGSGANCTVAIGLTSNVTTSGSLTTSPSADRVSAYTVTIPGAGASVAAVAATATGTGIVPGASGGSGAVVPPGTELAAALRIKSGTNLDPAGAANAWAGTTGLELLRALNVKAGTTGVGFRQTILTLNATQGLNATQELPWKI